MTEVKFGMITTNEHGNKRQAHRKKRKRGEENGESLIIIFSKRILSIFTLVLHSSFVTNLGTRRIGK